MNGPHKKGGFRLTLCMSVPLCMKKAAAPEIGLWGKIVTSGLQITMDRI
jgi:hypothetical protein